MALAQGELGPPGCLGDAFRTNKSKGCTATVNAGGIARLHIFVASINIYIRTITYKILNPGGIKNSDYKLSSIQAHVFLLFALAHKTNTKLSNYMLFE